MSRRASFRSGTRGQTNLDFAIGTAIFLLTVAAVFAFVPSMVQSFDGSRQSDTVVANRVASDLAERTLSVGSVPYVLDADCTVAFFDASRGSAACRFDNGGFGPAGSGVTDEMREQLGLSELDRIQISLRGPVGDDGATERLCWDEATDDVVAAGSADCVLADGDVPMATTDAPAGSSSVSTAVRVVSIDGRSGELVVKVW